MKGNLQTYVPFMAEVSRRLLGLRYSGQTTVGTCLSSELEIVQQLLHSDIEVLGPPLNTVIHAQLPASYPLTRAAIVLTAATDTHHKCESRDDLAQNIAYSSHIFLATALEMLYLALNVHKILLTDSTAAQDKIMLGSTILIGDYCFSRSARLAARTDSPLVVEIFAQSLKSISEAHLRHLFDRQQDDAPYDPHLELFQAGMMASAALDNRLTEEYRSLAITLSQQFSAQIQLRERDENHLIAIDEKTIAPLSQVEQEKWSDLVTWLNRINSAGKA